MPAANFPNVDPSDVEIVMNAPLQITRSLSGRETRNLATGPFFTLIYTFSNLNETERRLISGHIANANGQLQTFNVNLPDGLKTTTGDATGTIDVASNASAGAVSIDYTASVATIFKAGDFIKFDNHEKLYEVTEDSTTLGSNGTVKIFPPLRTDITTSEDILYSNLTALVRYNIDVSYRIRNDSFTDFTIEFLEVFE